MCRRSSPDYLLDASGYVAKEKTPALSPGLSTDDREPLFAGARVRGANGSRQRSGLNKTYLSRGRPTKNAGQAPPSVLVSPATEFVLLFTDDAAAAVGAPTGGR